MRLSFAFSNRSAAAMALAAMVLMGQSVGAQSADVDARFQPWLGCWKPATALAPMTAVSAERLAPPSPTMICIVPGASPTSVDVVNFAAGKVTERTTIDVGRTVNKSVGDCAGTETSSFSGDGARVLMRGTFTCRGGVTRVESGVMSINEDGEWVQVQGSTVGKVPSVYVAHFIDTGIALEGIVDGAIVERPLLDMSGTRMSPPRDGCTGGDTNTVSDDRTRVSIRSNYTCGNGVHRVANAQFVRNSTTGEWTRSDRRVMPFGNASVRAAVGAPVGVDGVQEVAKSVDPLVTEAWLSDRQQGFELNGKELVRLADAGVPSRVIDMMVALSNPNDFQLRRKDGSVVGGNAEPNNMQRTAETLERDRLCASNSFYCRGSLGLSWLYGYDGYFGYSPYGFGYPYSRFGYGYGYGYGSGYFGPGYYNGGGTVIIINRGGGGDATPPGRAVYGQGYTRGGRSSGGSSGGSSGTVSGGSAKSGGSSGGSSTSGSSSGSGGGSSSGSSGSTGRTAKPRGGGH